MDISARDARKYIDQLAAIDARSGDLMREWVEKNGTGDMQAMADYAYALVQKYGEASAALSAEMYDATAEAQGVTLPPAVPAEPAGYGEVAKTMYGIRKQSLNPESYASGVSRLVKRTGADTTLHNALRDGAEFAWVPFGDTCPFCIALASRGWQKISEKALKNGHAEHIHANCNCGYMTRQDGESGVAGYDPQKYADMYYGAEGSTPSERINSMRRIHYEQNKDAINAQKRAAYAVKHQNKEAQDSSFLGSAVGVALEDFRKKRNQDNRDDLLAVNPGYSTDKRRRVNCQRCVPAYELRKRGFDVVARPAPLNESGALICDRVLKDPYMLFEGFTQRLRIAGSYDGKGYIERRLLEYGDGARVQISVLWKEGQTAVDLGDRIVNRPSAHTFVAENRNGEIHFVDPQTGNDDCSNYFTKVKNGSTMFARIDDLRVNEEVLGLFVANRGGN